MKKRIVISILIALPRILLLTMILMMISNINLRKIHDFLALKIILYLNHNKKITKIIVFLLFFPNYESRHPSVCLYLAVFEAGHKNVLFDR